MAYLKAAAIALITYAIALSAIMLGVREVKSTATKSSATVTPVDDSVLLPISNIVYLKH